MVIVFPTGRFLSLSGMDIPLRLKPVELFVSQLNSKWAFKFSGDISNILPTWKENLLIKNSRHDLLPFGSLCHLYFLSFFGVPLKQKSQPPFSASSDARVAGVPGWCHPKFMGMRSAETAHNWILSYRQHEHNFYVSSDAMKIQISAPRNRKRRQPRGFARKISLRSNLIFRRKN